MFLVSNVEMVTAISNAGALGTFPALNFRPIEQYRQALQAIRKKTNQAIGVNIIVNKSNQRQHADLDHALEAGVELIITSLGTPKTVIEKAHQTKTKVFCDVTNLDHARKVQDMGADGVIAVGSGAGGHAGPISSLVLIPWLKNHLRIPVVAAGGIANGRQMAAALALGADGVSVGTRFIASTEARVDDQYKQAILNAEPTDIVLSSRISGTPASVINTEYIQQTSTELSWALKVLKDHPLSKKWVVPLIHWLGMKALEESAQRPTWKTVWSAGQTVGLIEDILPSEQIIKNFAQDYAATLNQMPRGSP